MVPLKAISSARLTVAPEVPKPVTASVEEVYENAIASLAEREKMLNVLIDKQTRLQMENGSMSDMVAKEVAIAVAAVDAHYSKKEEADRVLRDNVQRRFEQQLKGANTVVTPLMSVPECSMLHGAFPAEQYLPPRQSSSSPGQGPPPAGVPGGGNGPGGGDRKKKKIKNNRQVPQSGGDGDGSPDDGDDDDSRSSESSDTSDGLSLIHI